MAITLQQSRQSVTTGADSSALSFLALPQVNSLIVVTVSTFTGNLATTSVTDNQSNTYARAAVSNDFETAGGADDVAVYYALAATSSGTFTVTVNPDGASADITFHIQEYRGNATSTPLDQNNANAANGTAATSGNVTPGETNEVLVMAVSHSGSDRTITETNGTLVLENEGGSANMPLGTAYKVQTSVVTEGGAWTIGTGAVNWGAVIASFKSAAPAAGSISGTASGVAGHVANMGGWQAPLAVTLGSVASTTAAASYSTTSTYTPTAGRLVLVAVQNTKAGTPDTATVFGHGLTFTSAGTLTFNTIASASSRVSLFWAVGSSPTSGSTSASFGANQTGCSISVVEWAGLETAYSSASTVVQFSSSAANSVTTLSVPFAAFRDPGDAGYAALASSASVAINPRASWTEIHDLTYNSPTTRLETQWISVSDTAASGSPTSGSPNLGIVAVELLKSGVARGVAAGVFGFSASLTNGAPAGSITGTIPGTASQVGTLLGTGALSGTIPGVASQVGTLRVLAPISGTIPGVGAQTGTLTGRGALTGTVPGIGAQVGTLTGRGALTGIIPGVAAQVGTLTATGALNGATAGIGTATGTLSGTTPPAGALDGTIPGTSTALAVIGATGALAANSPNAGSTTGSITGTGALTSTAAGSATAALTLTGLGIIDGAAIGQAILLAALLGYGALQGQGDGSGYASGALQSVIPATGPGTRDIISPAARYALAAQTDTIPASARATLKAARSAISVPGRKSPKSQG